MKHAKLFAKLNYLSHDRLHYRLNNFLNNSKRNSVLISSDRNFLPFEKALKFYTKTLTSNDLNCSRVLKKKLRQELVERLAQLTSYSNFVAISDDSIGNHQMKLRIKKVSRTSLKDQHLSRIQGLSDKKILDTIGSMIKIKYRINTKKNVWAIVSDNNKNQIITQLRKKRRILFRVSGIGKHPILVLSDEIFEFLHN